MIGTVSIFAEICRHTRFALDTFCISGEKKHVAREKYTYIESAEETAVFTVDILR